MNGDPLLEHLFRHESGRLLAAVARILGPGRLDLAEDVVQDALAKALHEWRFHGPPKNPAAWLQRVARNRALDLARRESSWKRREERVAAELERVRGGGESSGEFDDELGLMFACCHPGLSSDSQVALVLKTLGGLSTGEIAAAFLADERTIAQRIVRAKRTLADSRDSFAIPTAAELPARLDAVLRSLYLLFNEGYHAHAGSTPIRAELCSEAIRLGEMLSGHTAGDVSRTHALLALFEFQASRLPARVDDAGSLLLLEDQDRTRWDRRLIDRAHFHLERAGRGDAITVYHWEAAIAACHASSPSFESTDWRTILDCYDALWALTGSPVVAVNRGIARAKVEGTRRGIEALEETRSDARLRDYFLLPAALGKLYADLGEASTAIDCYNEALRLARTRAERDFLNGRIARLTSSREDS